MSETTVLPDKQLDVTQAPEQVKPYKAFEELKVSRLGRRLEQATEAGLQEILLNADQYGWEGDLQNLYKGLILLNSAAITQREREIFWERKASTVPKNAQERRHTQFKMKFGTLPDDKWNFCIELCLRNYSPKGFSIPEKEEQDTRLLTGKYAEYPYSTIES